MPAYFVLYNLQFRKFQHYPFSWLIFYISKKNSRDLLSGSSFNRQNLPVFRLNIESTSFTTDGALQQMEGIGKIIVGIEYYNPRIFIWEPFMEKWSPNLKFETI